MKIWTRLRNLWKRLRRRHSFDRVVRVGSMADLPAKLGGTLYVVSEHGHSAKWTVLDCPCRCGERIYVNLMKSRDPHWQLRLLGDELTLRPSLWVPQDKCGSHFWVKRNIIEWVK